MIVCDASAVFESVRIGRPERLNGQCTSALAVYELGNVVWKNAVLGRMYDHKEATRLLTFYESVLEEMRVVHNDLSDIYNIASKCRISFYDAAYVCLAVDMNVALVTLDKKLIQKASTMVGILSFDQFIES